MLEILGIIFLARYAARKARENGRNGSLFGAMAVALWIVPEFLGGFLGALYLSEEWMAYVAAIAGAGIGVVITIAVVTNLKPLKSEESSAVLDSPLE